MRRSCRKLQEGNVFTGVCLSGGRVGRYQWRIQDFPDVGRQLSGGGGRGEHTILPNFPKNCMKLREFGSRGGVRVPRAYLKSATGYPLPIPHLPPFLPTPHIPTPYLHLPPQNGPKRAVCILTECILVKLCVLFVALSNIFTEKKLDRGRYLSSAPLDPPISCCDN